jgi:hypothetical protein
VHDDVHVLLGEVPVGREVAVLVLRARREREGQRVERRARRRRRLRPPDRAELARRAEAVEVLAPGLQAAELDVDAVAVLRAGDGRPRWTVRAKRSSRATSMSTGIRRWGMPPPLSGAGASRVQRATPSGAGSPDATPRVKG